MCEKHNFGGCPREFYHRFMYKAPSCDHLLLTKVILRKFEVVCWCLEWEKCTLKRDSMKINSKPPIQCYGFDPLFFLLLLHRDFNWSPASNVLSYWTPEEKENPARVTLMAIPSRQELRIKNLFSVADCKLHWQKQGHFLCVKVDRLSKSKKVMIIITCVLYSAFPTNSLCAQCTASVCHTILIHLYLYPRIHVVYKGVYRNQLPQFLTNSHQI